MLKNYQGFVFDWDGTILNSMPIKYDSFSLVMIDQFFSKLSNPEKSEKKEEIIGYYRKLSGLPRPDLFKSVAMQAGVVVQEADYEGFNIKFSLLNKSKLAQAEIFSDALSFLKQLVKANKKIFISSSVPQSELQYLVEILIPLEIKQNISEILGSLDNLVKGDPHLSFIQNKYSIRKDELLFFGDAYEDFRLGTLAGVETLLVNRFNELNNINLQGKVVFNDFTEIMRVLW